MLDPINPEFEPGYDPADMPTSAPWTLKSNRDRVFPTSVMCPDDAEVARVVRNEDARLIAAAPDMLEALKLARQDVFHHVPDPVAAAHLTVIDAAIAKAEGTEK